MAGGVAAEQKPSRKHSSILDVRLLFLLLLCGALAVLLVFDVRVLQHKNEHIPPPQQYQPRRYTDPSGREFLPSAHWGADWVIVVTNYQRELSWLARLPLHLGVMRLVIYIKQDHRAHRTCDMLPAELRPWVAACRELPNANGRDLHTIAQFFVEFYDRLPRMVVFLQDDCARLVDGEWTDWSCFVPHLKLSTVDEFAAFTNRAEAEPFEQDTCLCRVETELNFRKCPQQDDTLPYEFRTGPTRCYGDLWHPVSILFDLGVAGRVDLRREQLRWPRGAQFAAPGWAVRHLPLSFYKTALLLLDASGDDVHSTNSTLLLRMPEIGKTWSSFEWGHAFERAWFGLLDPKYQEKLERDALLTPEAPWAPPQPPMPQTPEAQR